MNNQSAMQIIVINIAQKIGLYTLITYKFIEYMDCHNIVHVHMLWFNFTIGLIFMFFCWKLILMHYNTQEQGQIKFKLRIKFNHHTYWNTMFTKQKYQQVQKNYQNTQVLNLIYLFNFIVHFTGHTCFLTAGPKFNFLFLKNKVP